MSKNFIDEIRSIVLNNISDEKFGVPELVSELGLSKSQTLRKVKAATGKSVNQYIRELRLEKAAKLLKKTDFNIAEISYQVGFGSASYFNTAFSNYFGIAPGEYKNKSISLSELRANKPKNIKRKVSLKQKIFFPIIIVFVLIIVYLLINPITSKNTTLDNSIAVLPFKNLSPEDTQWFSDGISDNILHSLAQMKDLSVISFTSSSTYRETDKQIPEIAKELGVSYILEGSVTLYEGELKIIAQLIDANDNHVWSKEYNETFDDIITVQKNVAEEVMNQLEITLSPQETIIHKKYPTENMEAYNLYLKGRLINDSRKVEDLWQNIELNKQAIALDSSFAEAYAEVANSYSLLTSSRGFSNWNINSTDSFEAIELSHKYADMAISIDPNSNRAWAVKARLSLFIDWDKANKFFKKALILKPNDAQTHLQYAWYFRIRPNPDVKKYLEHLTISQQLDPVSKIMAKNYLAALIFNHKIKEAEDYLIRNGFQFSESQKLIYESRIIAYKNKDWTTVIPYLKTKIEKDPNNSRYYRVIAWYYRGILNDDSTALIYGKKAYEIDSTNFSNISRYFYKLVEAKKYNEVKELMESENYKSVLNEEQQIYRLWYYHNHQGNSKEAHKISTDSLLTNQYFLQALNYARLGDRKKVDSINKLYPWGTGNMLNRRATRAVLHAVLKDRDSMYHYLNEVQFDDYALFANGRSEMDPYRNEERFKAFQRKNYLPVPGE